MLANLDSIKLKALKILLDKNKPWKLKKKISNFINLRIGILAKENAIKFSVSNSINYTLFLLKPKFPFKNNSKFTKKPFYIKNNKYNSIFINLMLLEICIKYQNTELNGLKLLLNALKVKNNLSLEWPIDASNNFFPLFIPITDNKVCSKWFYSSL